MMSRKVIDEYCDYDPDSIVSVGYKWTVYDDGHVAVQKRSRWSGSRTDCRAVTDPGYAGVMTAKEIADNDFDEIDMLLSGDGESRNYRITDNGYVIQ